MAFKPSEITREHVLKGIEELKKSNKKLTNGTRWEVFIDDVPYPPKEVMRFARAQYDGSKDWPRGGGWPTNEFLEKMGFEVKEKNNNPILTLIANYKNHIKETQLKDEEYKWQLVKEYAGKPDTNAVDFYQEIKSIKYGNLVYAMGIAVLHHLLKEKPEEIRAAFKVLFDENTDLVERIAYFNTETLKIYRGLGETLQHHQDERSISTYLTFHNPEKYTFYKASFYKSYCQLLGIKEAKKNEKYVHYLDLINDLVENYIKPDSELIDLVSKAIPEYYNGKNNMILAQDILYQMLDKKEAVNAINVKSEFIDWMVANVSGGNYFERQFGSNRERFENEINEYEVKYKENFNSELFIITTTDYKNEIELIRTNLYNTSTPFSEYSNNHASGRPKAMLGKKQYLRFLEERFGTGNSVNYWIFQGSPKIYDAVTAINNDAVATWTVSAHKDKIKEGDKFILWLTGANAGCYALGTIASEVTMMKEEDAEMSYYLSPTPQVENNRVRITIDYNLTESPVLWEMVKEDEAFADFKGSNQGTNFTATKEQYETFLDLASMENDNFEKVLQKFEFEDLKSYFNLLFEIIDTLNLKQGEERLLFTYRKDRLSFTIGQRIALLLLKKHHKGKYFVLTKDKIRPTSENFAGKEPLPFGTYLNELDLVPSERQSVFDGVLQELKRVQRSSYRSKNYSDFEEAVFNPAFRLRFKKTTNSIMSYKAPINQILYGPPGTGKTYTLKTDYFPKYTLKETSITKELFFEETVRNLTWWQVIAIALIENGTSRVNDILTNRWVALKAELSESKNVRATLWGTLQMHTINESKTVAYTQRQTPFVFDKNEDKSWMLLENELKEQSPELYDILESVNNFKANPEKEIKHYVFTTFHQSFSYEDFIEGIKPKMDDETETNELTYKIESGIFKELCSRAQSDPSNRYAIFIDEINRGNVSQIFGELITLIETDKRLGAVNEMKVKLPYSKKEFGVPSNIDIYGTMNTADRSVEALDTALRRRFSFKELMPNSEVVNRKGFTDYSRNAIMEKINNRIEVLLDRNHTLGHAYFIKPDFKRSFENEIIPLLQEYFYNDYGKIGLILGKGFVREKSIAKTNDKSIFADFETKNEVDIIKSYELIPFNEVDFGAAITTLLA